DDARNRTASPRTANVVMPFWRASTLQSLRRARTPGPRSVGFGSNSAVPSTTEHSRSTFSCGRTVTPPSRPRSGRAPELETGDCDRRRIETPYKPLYAADVARNTGTAAEREAKRAPVP